MNTRLLTMTTTVSNSPNYASRFVSHLWTSLLRFGPRDHGWAEFWFGVGLVVWSLVNVFGNAPLSRTNFGPILSLAPERVWEVATLCIGLAQIYAVIVDGLVLRTASAFFASIILGMITINLVIALGWPPGGTGLYLAAGGGNLTAMFKCIRRFQRTP